MAAFANIKENEINVKYGLYNFGEEREGARGSLRYIIGDIQDIKMNYVRLGFHLLEFKLFEYYKDFGYLKFEEFCEKNIPLDKSNIRKCIAVYQRFRAQTGMNLDDRYNGYNYSQLVEMLGLDDVSLNHVTPDMSVRAIRNYKRALKGNVVARATSPKSEEKECEQITVDEYVETLAKEKLSDHLEKDVLQEIYKHLHRLYECDMEIVCSDKSIMFRSSEETYRLRLDKPKKKVM